MYYLRRKGTAWLEVTTTRRFGFWWYFKKRGHMMVHIGFFRIEKADWGPPSLAFYTPILDHLFESTLEEMPTVYDNEGENESPCAGCTTGWGTYSEAGIEDCSKSCDELKLFLATAPKEQGDETTDETAKDSASPSDEIINRLGKKLDLEKMTRIKYQDIVYKVCLLFDMPKKPTVTDEVVGFVTDIKAKFAKAEKVVELLRDRVRGLSDHRTRTDFRTAIAEYDKEDSQ